MTRGLPSPVEVITAEDGDVLRFDADGGRIVEKTPVGKVLIDGTRVGEVNDEVLRDRRHISTDGLIVPVVAINARSRRHRRRAGAGRARVCQRRRHRRRARRGRAASWPTSIDECSVEERADPGLMKERIRVELRKFLKKRTGRRPMVLPVVMEI